MIGYCKELEGLVVAKGDGDYICCQYYMEKTPSGCKDRYKSCNIQFYIVFHHLMDIFDVKMLFVGPFRM